MAKCFSSDLVRVFSLKSEFIGPDRTKKRVRRIRDRILLWKVTETVTEEVRCQQKRAGEFAYSNGRAAPSHPPAASARERERSCNKVSPAANSPYRAPLEKMRPTRCTRRSALAAGANIWTQLPGKFSAHFELSMETVFWKNMSQYFCIVYNQTLIHCTFLLSEGIEQMTRWENRRAALVIDVTGTKMSTIFLR
jgi:hypothetical protein